MVLKAVSTDIRNFPAEDVKVLYLRITYGLFREIGQCFAEADGAKKISFAFPSHSQCFLDVSPCTVKKKGEIAIVLCRCGSIVTGEKEGCTKRKMIFSFQRTLYRANIFSLAFSYSDGYWITTLTKRKVELYEGFKRKEKAAKLY